MEKIALVIPTVPARKPAGFGGLGFPPLKQGELEEQEVVTPSD